MASIEVEQPNVLIIMIDDLNDNVQGYNGHGQSISPNILALSQSSVSFRNAHCNAPMCGPSRASLFTGILPHNSRNFYQKPWYKNPVLANSKTMMELFKESGYQVLGSGKILHHLVRENWNHYENIADYSPTPFDGEVRLPHPDVPEPFSDIGWVDGSLGPFTNLEDRLTKEGKPLKWVTGNPTIGYNTMRYVNDDDRDSTPDEVNADWAANQISKWSDEGVESPFFMAVGFLRPHTPLVAPQKYFDKFSLDKIDLAVTKVNDSEDTFLRLSYAADDVHALRFGKEMFEAIEASYGSTELGLKKWTQAYLACVAAVDDNVGQVIDALNSSKFKDNTIVILASDHGFHMGEKNYLYKNSLWEESTRVPLIISAPGFNQGGTKIDKTVSLIDIYPTLIDLCNLSKNTLKSKEGHALDGQSLLPLLKDANSSDWKDQAALTAVYAGDKIGSDPLDQHYSIRTDDYRYIKYNTGHEELYDHMIDEQEWNNVINDDDKYGSVREDLRAQLQELIEDDKATR